MTSSAQSTKRNISIHGEISYQHALNATVIFLQQPRPCDHFRAVIYPLLQGGKRRELQVSSTVRSVLSCYL